MLIRQENDLIKLDFITHKSEKTGEWLTYYIGFLKDINGECIPNCWGSFENEFRSLDTLNMQSPLICYPLY